MGLPQAALANGPPTVLTFTIAAGFYPRQSFVYVAESVLLPLFQCFRDFGSNLGLGLFLALGFKITRNVFGLLLPSR